MCMNNIWKKKMKKKTVLNDRFTKQTPHSTHIHTIHCTRHTHTIDIWHGSSAHIAKSKHTNRKHTNFWRECILFFDQRSTRNACVCVTCIDYVFDWAAVASAVAALSPPDTVILSNIFFFFFFSFHLLLVVSTKSNAVFSESFFFHLSFVFYSNKIWLNFFWRRPNKNKQMGIKYSRLKTNYPI